MNNELIKNLEYIERLTPEGRKDIKDYVIKLEQENKELHNKMEKAIEYINNSWTGGYTDTTLKYKVEEINITELLEILKGDVNE